MAAEDSYELSLAVRTLLQAGRQMQSAAARQLGVRITDVQAMDLVTAAGNRISPTELADQLGIRTASVSALIDRLVDAGHLVRSPAPQNEAGTSRRRTNVEATTHARNEVKKTLREVNDGFRALGTDLSHEDAVVVLDFLQRATDILRSYVENSEEPAQQAPPSLSDQDSR
ncbi:MAG TPA: MarR family winged helix-turn-helix transcriptional regulator [Microlunatus sp.]